MKGIAEPISLKEKKTHFRNLVALARIDGHFHEDEKALICTLGKRYALREKQLREILDESQPAIATVPTDRRQQLDQLRDLVLLMLADGYVVEKEMIFCKEIASQYGFGQHVIEKLVQWVEEEPVSGATWHENREGLLEINKSLAS
ncbi:hypothetical protein AB9P05_08495 [Roseivirga sp. BDSF3-8]|uniref:tellurite resistance TerB family protein n=1 Tax=Roseivirga sp. BDSF3-8 TaxID=3241598 RepID=UPI00353260C8